MSLEKKLNEDLKDAMRAGETDRRDTIRLVIAELKKARLDKPKDAVFTPEEELAVLTREVKKRKESIEVYRKGEREDLAAKEETELAIIKTYLPEELTREKVVQLVKDIIAQVGAQSLKDLGKVMGPLSPQIKGRFDGKQATDIVKEQLQAL
jgi:uncharacterized protein YqeY